MTTALPPGIRVTVRSLSERPLEEIDETLVIDEVAAPDPAQLKPDEVILAVRSAGVSWVDLLMTSGQYQHQPRLPYCPGLEYSGVVVGVGAAVEPRCMGQAAFVDCFTVGPRTSGAYQSAGGFSSYAVVPAAALRAIPSGFSFDQACNYAGSYETAYHCLIARGR